MFSAMQKSDFITFPVDEDKKPLIKKWSKITKSSRSRARWGIPCGELNNLTVVDVDVGERGLEYWGLLVQEHGEIETPMVRTPSGGLHLYFNHMPGLKNWVRAVKDGDGKPVGIDVRTQDGYVIGFASAGYELVKDVPRIDMPGWLVDILMLNNTVEREPTFTPLTLGGVSGVDSSNPMIQRAVELFADCPESSHYSRVKSVDGDSRGLVVSMKKKRNSPYDCRFCDKRHETDNNVMILVCPDDNKVFIGCIKDPSKKKLFLGHLHETRAEEVKESSLEKAVRTVLAEDLSKREKREYYAFKNLGVSYKTFDKPYCSDEPALMECKSTILAIKSGTGTGKTNAVSLKIMKDKPDRCLFSTFRIGQIGQLMNDKYKDIPGLVAYNEKKADGTHVKLDNSQKAIICQMESFHRITWCTWKTEKAVFCVDEANQIRKQMTSETFMKQPKAKDSWKTFKQAVRYASQIVLMDAHLSPETISWFQDLRGGRPETTLFVNHFKKPNTSEIVMVPNAVDVLADAEKKLELGKRVYIACNGSVEKTNAYAEIFKNEGKRVLVVHRETLTEPAVKYALEHVETWGEYDVVITSPSIQSGLSFDLTNVFDSVYGIFGNYTSASTDCIQMLARVRHPINPKIMVSVHMGNNNHKLCSREAVIDSLASKTSHLEVASAYLGALVDYEKDENNNRVFAPNDYFDTYINNVVEASLDRQYFIWNFLRSQREAGFKITVGVCMSEDLKKAYTRKIKAIIEAQKKQNATAIRSAITLADADIDKIKARLVKGLEITRQDVLGLKKNNILKAYDKCEEDLPETEAERDAWFRDYGDKKVIKHFYNQRNESRGSFTEVLASMKAAEQKSEESKLTYKPTEQELRNFHTGLVDYTEDRLEPTDLDKSVAIMTTVGVVKYQKWVVLFDWLATMGFTSLDSAAEITPSEIKSALTMIQERITNANFDVLDKDPRTLPKFKALDRTHKRYVEWVLVFVNGSLKSEFGVSVGKKAGARHAIKNYILKNKYLTKHPRFSMDDNPDRSIPVLRPAGGMNSRSAVIDLGLIDDGDETSEGEDIEYD